MRPIAQAGPQAAVPNMLSLPHWSAKVEYLYLDFDSYVWTNASNSFFSCTGLNCSTDARFDVVRVGLNYRFGWH
jgi:opacity protein-like surface antigen